MVIGLAGGCTEADPPFEYKEAYKTYLYSAAIDDATGPVWVKVYNLELIGIDAIDVDSDTSSELVIGLAVERTDLPDGARNMRSIALEDTDGSVAFDVTRALTR